MKRTRKSWKRRLDEIVRPPRRRITPKLKLRLALARQSQISRVP